MADVVDDSKVFVVRDGGIEYSMYLPNCGTDFIQTVIEKRREPYEVEMLRSMASRIAADEVFIDIGANVGNHSIYMAAAVGCEVVSFEPNKELVKAIEKSASLNKFDHRLTVHQIGLSNKAGKAVFGNQNPKNLGSQRLLEDEVGEVRIRVFDELGVPGRIRVMKVDVEGMEFHVLRGARKRIAQDKPFIYVECQNIHIFRKISGLMNDLGYYLVGTFNASPTHLFAPLDHVEQPEQRDALRMMEVERLYSLRAELKKTQAALDARKS